MIPAELMEAGALFADEVAAYWMQNLKIIDMNDELIPFEANTEQVRLLTWIGAQIAAGVPVRIIILKYRRGGFSTATTGLFYYLINRERNRRAMACAHDSDGTDTLYHMTNIFEEEVPGELRRGTDYSSKAEIVYSAPHRSSYRFHTAGSPELARSKQVSFLHLSEEGFYLHAAKTLTAVLQTVANKPGTIIIEETTANGATGVFYNRWNAAVKYRKAHPDDVTGIIPLFYGWLNFPDYQMDVPPDHTFEADPDEYEDPLLRLGMTPKQRYWRGMTLAEKCSGDPEKFCQEYPSTESEAFRSSGKPAIPLRTIRRHQAQAEAALKDIKRMVLLRDSTGTVIAQETTKLRNVWLVLHPPVGSLTDYTVGGDVYEGLVSDPDDERSDRDYDAAAVLNRRLLRFEAIYHGRIDPDDFGREIQMAAEYYNNAWASPEANSPGAASVAAMKTYFRLYQREIFVDQVDEGKLMKGLGWKTTTGNRDFMLDSWLAFTRHHPTSGWENRLVVPFELLAEEELHFVRRKDGKREHDVGYKDDILFAAMIALQLHIDCPRTLTPETPSFGKDLVAPDGHVGVPSFQRIGGVDNYDADDKHEDTR